MKSFCYDFLKANFGDLLKKSDKFLRLSSTVWFDLLNEDLLNMTDLKLIWKTIVKWVEAENDRAEFVPDLLRIAISTCKSIDAGSLPTFLRSRRLRQIGLCDEILNNVDAIVPRVKRTQIQPVCVMRWSPLRKNSNGFQIQTRCDRNPSGTRNVGVSRTCSVYWRRNVFYIFDSRYRDREEFAVRSGSNFESGTPVEYMTEIGAAVASQFFCFHDSKTLIYDTDTEIWREGPPMPFTLYDCCAVMLCSKIYLFGSENQQWYGIVYEPERGTWNHASAPNVYRNDVQFASHCGFIYAIGGAREAYDSYVTTVERYDPSTDQWTLFADLPHPFAMPRAFAIGNLLVVFENGYKMCGVRYLKESDPVYLHPMSSVWVVLKENRFIEMLRMFSIPVLVDE